MKLDCYSPDIKSFSSDCPLCDVGLTSHITSNGLINLICYNCNNFYVIFDIPIKLNTFWAGFYNERRFVRGDGITNKVIFQKMGPIEDLNVPDKIFTFPRSDSPQEIIKNIKIILDKVIDLLVYS